MSAPLAHAAGADETLSLILLFAGIWVAWIGWSRLRGTGFARVPRWGGWALICAAVALAVAATAVPRMVLKPTQAPASIGPRPASTATLRFLAPENGFITSGDELTVRMELTGATITSVTSTTVSSDTGHLHLSLDGTLVSMTGGTLQVVDLREVAPGPHTLTASFVAADHLPFDPPVIAEVAFERTSS